MNEKRKTKNEKYFKALVWAARFLFVFIAVSILHSCAIMVPPTGGKKDTTPPKIVSENPPNYSTFFNSPTVKIVFSEYVVLNNIGTEAIVTPSIKAMPKFKLRGKTLTITLRDSLLKPNTTYSILFGKAIADLNEGNVLQNYRYVFSTGSYIDSLGIHGHLEDALTHKPLDNISINLYDSSMTDTAMFKRKPEYYTRDSANGKFDLKNLPDKKFRIMAIQDKNGNYLPDEGEEVGIYTPTVQAVAKPKENEKLVLSVPYPSKLRIKRTVFTGRRLTIKFNKPVDSFQLKGGQYYTTVAGDVKDSFTVWFEKDTFQRWLSVVPKGEIKDSLLKKNAKNSHDDSILKVTILNSEKTINKYGVFALQFSQPVGKINLAKIRFKRDSVLTPVKNVFFTDSSRTVLILGNKFDEDHNYKIAFPKGCFESIYHIKSDSAYTTYAIPDRRNYGSINIRIGDSLNLPLIFQIVDADKGTVFYEKRLYKTEILDVNYITPGKYQLRLVYDKNRNGYWDPLDMAHDIQPEEIVYYPDILTIKANWELNEMRFSWKSVEE